jgi:single-strand DNA-binding protein
MSQGLNKVILIGNLGGNPELRYTQSGQAVLTISMATNERFKNRDDEWQDRTEWHRVIVWAKRAEGLNKVLEKGSQICVEGKLQTRSWEDKDGIKRFTTEIIAREVLLLGRKNGGSNAPPHDDDDYYGGGGSGNYVDNDGGSGGGSGGGGGGGGGGSGGGSGHQGDAGEFSDDDVPF